MPRWIVFFMTTLFTALIQNDSGSYIYDGLGMLPQTGQVVSGLQAPHRRRETLQDRCSSPEGQARTLQLVEFIVLRQHFKSVLEGEVEEEKIKENSCRWLRFVSIGLMFYTNQVLSGGLAATSLNKGKREREEEKTSKNVSGVRSRVRRTHPCRKPELCTSLPLPLSPICLCHCAVGHAACFPPDDHAETLEASQRQGPVIIYSFTMGV